MIARGIKAGSETPCGSVHESPIRDQRTRPTLKTSTPLLDCIMEDLSEASAGNGQLRVDYRRKLLRITYTKNVVWETNVEGLTRAMRAPKPRRPHQGL